MYLILDVDYRDDNAKVAGILFEDHSNDKTIDEITTMVNGIHEYIPGEFYKRELPCLLQLIEFIEKSYTLSAIIVDSHVWLKDETDKGMGAYLYYALEEKYPVIGIAKNPFYESCALPVIRGESKNPLWVTSAGINTELAANLVKDMHGEYRLPTLVKKVDHLCRE